MSRNGGVPPRPLPMHAFAAEGRVRAPLSLTAR